MNRVSDHNHYSRIENRNIGTGKTEPDNIKDASVKGTLYQICETNISSSNSSKNA